MIDLHTLTRRVVHGLLPVDCATCGVPLSGDPIPFFCASCWDSIRPLRTDSCPRCGHSFASPVALRHSPWHLCAGCRKRKPSFTQAWSLYAYEGTLSDALCLFKYRGKVVLRGALAGLMKAAWHPVPDLDILIPVPLHPARLREREFNQALLLADSISRWDHLPVSYDNLIRTRPTTPQSRLTQRARRQNLRRSFAVRRPDEVRNRRVLLVDDVYTTGTTVNECAKALRKAGSSDVYVVTLARTV